MNDDLEPDRLPSGQTFLVIGGLAAVAWLLVFLAVELLKGSVVAGFLALAAWLGLAAL